MIHIKRVYEEPEKEDGMRILVDRLWPRGVSKEHAGIDAWLKDVAPSDALRRSFCHDPSRWEGFRERYFAELDSKPEAWKSILGAARSRPVTLLYAAKDQEHNNAVALREYLLRRTTKTISKPS